MANRTRYGLHIGHFLFRTRNVLFPAVFLAVVALFPPPPRGAAWAAAGLTLLVTGQALRVTTIGFRYIKRGGKDGRIFAHGLVTGGVFAHSRNPMYAGNLLVVSGLLVTAGNAIGMAVGIAFFVTAYVAIILAEETYLEARFGEEYRAYRARVPRFVPRFRGLLTTLRPLPFDWKRVVAKEHGTLFLNLMLAVGVLAYAGHRAGDLGRRLPALAAAAVAGTLLYAAARIAKKRTAWLKAERA